MKINVVCHHQLRNELTRGARLHQAPVYLSADARYGNVYLDPAAIARNLGSPLDSLSRDLCEIAAYVYLADKALSRGQYEKWMRNLSFLVPVRNPTRWNAVKSLLINTIGTLSGDNVDFTFVRKAEDESLESFPPLGRPLNLADPDCVSLFSGGLDSFAGAVHLIEHGRRPLFASHYVSALKGLQRELLSALEHAFGQTFEHLQYRVTTRKTTRTRFPFTARESSHRARSFLFMSFAAAAAAVRGLTDIYICENGVLSLNVPISDARKGTRSTRHAHPLYLLYFNQLINALYGREFVVENPFRFWTKGEEAKLLDTPNLRRMIGKTVSCWGYPNQTLRYPNSNHCGVCIPCIVRRVSLVAAGLEAYDDQYVVDAFRLAANANPKDRRNVEDLVYFCQCFATLSKSELLYRYPELVMIEVGESSASEDRVEKILRVYRRFADEVLTLAKERYPNLLPGSPSEAAATGGPDRLPASADEEGDLASNCA
jgi:7-cyano-7-deazaguanine synthase in queuosine biosynthesis